MKMSCKQCTWLDVHGNVPGETTRNTILTPQINNNLLISKDKKLYSAMAQANPKPSKVEVPLPNSSIMTRESFVAVWRKEIMTLAINYCFNTHYEYVSYPYDVCSLDHFGHES